MHSYEFFIETEKKHIDFINKIIEAYEGVGVVRTLDPHKGLLTIITTSHYIDFAREIIRDLDSRGVMAKILKEGPWEGVL